MIIFKDGIFILVIAAILCLWGIFYCIYRDYTTKRLNIGDRFIYPSKEILVIGLFILQKKLHIKKLVNYKNINILFQ